MLAIMALFEHFYIDTDTNKVPDESFSFLPSF